MIHDFPWTDMHELNLDWFLAEFKKLVEEWNQVQGEWNSLHDYVQTYFDNLNVQTEIDNKINAMIADGSFATIVTPLVEVALPTIVDGKLPAVVASQISVVVAAQIGAVVANQLPAIAASAAATEVGDWLASHINPDTGYVIDDSLTVSQAAADAKTVGDKISDLSDNLDTLNSIFSICYVNTSDIDFDTEEYYQNNGTTASAIGTNYHVADPVTVPPGVYTLIQVIPAFCYYEINGVFTKVSASTSRGDVTLTLTDYATIYLTTRTADQTLKIGMVTGSHIPDTLIKGIYDMTILNKKYSSMIDDCEKTVIIHYCYANNNSFDFLTDKYYNSNGTVADAAPGSNYHVAAPFRVKAGVLTFRGIIPSFSFYMYDGDVTGTQLSTSASMTEGLTLTLIKDAVIYLTCRTSNHDRSIFAVDGTYIPDWNPTVGIYDVMADGVSLQDLNHRSEISGYYEDADNTSLSMYEKVAVIGDSYSSGGLYGIPGIQTQGRHLSIAWLAVLARRCGFTSRIYGVTGGNTYTFLNDTTSEYGLTAMLNDPPHNLYFIMLGINGDEDDNIGTIADCNVDWTQNGDSFYGRYGQIIGNIMNHAPKAKIVCIVPPQGTQRFQAIMDVADFYEVPYFKTLDDIFFHSDFYVDNQFTSHPIGVTYAGMANAINRLYSKCVMDNVTYFQDYEG